MTTALVLLLLLLTGISTLLPRILLVLLIRILLLRLMLLAMMLVSIVGVIARSPVSHVSRHLRWTALKIDVYSPNVLLCGVLQI